MRHARQTTLSAILITLGALAPAAEAGDGHWRHHGGWHGGHHSSFGFYFDDPWLWAPRLYYRPYPPVYYPSQTIIVEREPSVYVQRQPPVSPAPTAQLWYYCPSSAGYYPQVPSCPTQWVPVDPRSLPPVSTR
jgi:hypothetical protein